MPRATRRSRSDPLVSRGIDRDAVAREHRARVEAGFDLHEADAGLLVTGEQRALDGRGAAPARQEREVNVHETERERIEQGGGQQLPERDDDARFGAARGDVVDDLTGFHRRGDRQAELGRGLLHRRRIRAPSPRAARVGLRDDERDFVARRDQRAQRRNGRSRRPEIDEAHQSA